MGGEWGGARGGERETEGGGAGRRKGGREDKQEIMTKMDVSLSVILSWNWHPITSAAGVSQPTFKRKRI